MNTLELYRRTVLHSVQIVAGVTPAMLAAPTPCVDWDLAKLLRHMISEHRGFASAVRGNTTDVVVWAEQPLGDSPADEYAAAARDVLEALADTPADVLWLPNIGVGPRMYPLRRALSFHLLDYVIHGWDVAAAVGGSRAIDDELVEATLRIARMEVPDKPARLLPGASFAAALPMSGDETPCERMLRTLGRRADWSPPIV